MKPFQKYRPGGAGGSRGGFGGGGFGGGRKPSFGGGRGGFAGGRSDFKELFDAVCAECGDNCQVPFRPNGRKPVLCTRCFKKDDGEGQDRGSFERPSHFAKRDFAERAPAPRMPDNSKELRAINEKLDAILDLLNEALVIEGDEEGEGEEEAEGENEDGEEEGDPTETVVV